MIKLIFGPYFVFVINFVATQNYDRLAVIKQKHKLKCFNISLTIQKNVAAKEQTKHMVAISVCRSIQKAQFFKFDFRHLKEISKV